MHPTTLQTLWIGASLVAALVLRLLPMSPGWEVWRPPWVLLTLLYWSMTLPHRVGVGVAWLTGLFTDVATGAVLGQHALGYAVTVYLMLRLHAQIRSFPLLQQAAAVALLLVPYMSIMLWVRGVAGHPPGSWNYWLPLASAVPVWLVLAPALGRLTRSVAGGPLTTDRAA
jgi:rod shape-determining protein MreD